jgi:hypothetical protein
VTTYLYADNLLKHIFHRNLNYTSKQHYEYDAQGTVLEWYFSDKKNASLSNRADSTHITYTYTSNGKVTNELEYHYSFCMHPHFFKNVDTLKSIGHHFDDNGAKVKTFIQRLDTVNSTWIDHMQKLYTYNENKTLAEKIIQIAIDSSFINSTREVYTYDSNDSLRAMEKQCWDSTGFWKTSNIITRSYYDFGPLQEEIESNPYPYVRYLKRVYTYEGQTHVKDKIFSLNKNTPRVSVITDRLHHTATISVTVANESAVSFEIYSVSGRMIQRICRNRTVKAGTTALSWNGLTSQGTHTGPGIYFYRLRTKHTLHSGKILFAR